MRKTRICSSKHWQQHDMTTQSAPSVFHSSMAVKEKEEEEEEACLFKEEVPSPLCNTI